MDAELNQPGASRLSAWDRRRLPIVPRWLVPIVAVVVVLAVGGAWAIGQLGSSHAPKRSSSAAPAYTGFRDPAGAFAGSYPASWQRLTSSDPQDVLLAAGPQGGSYLVRKTPISAPVTSANLAAAKKLTESVVHSGKDVKLLRQPQAITLGGLPGYLYLYTFRDAATGQVGAHAHYFLFQGKTMITLVFQSLPSNHFVSLAPVFDRIANTFHTLHR